MPEEIYTNFTTKNAELYHHGIEGQKWGIRNGPPYPLDSNGDTKRAKKINKLNHRLQKEENTYKKKVANASSFFDDNVLRLDRTISKINMKADKIRNSDKQNKDILAAELLVKKKLKSKIMYRDALQTLQKEDPEILYAVKNLMDEAYNKGFGAGMAAGHGM